jgi:glycosyltransferase involved in cell wall biosynthesis
LPRVTVIVPNYNHARYLDRRLESVLGQTFRDFELLFLDDASTDDSRRVFSAYASDPRVRALFNDRNSGSTFRQWNRGLREARGEYVWLAESDDYADERLLERLVNQLDEHPQAGLAYCRSWIIDAAGDLKQLSGYPEEDGKVSVSARWAGDFVNDGRHECARYLFDYNTIPNASAALLRRSVCEQVGLAPEDMKICGDWMFWARMMLVSGVAYISEPLNYYRTHASSVRSKTRLNGVGWEEELRVKAYIAGALPGARLKLGAFHRWFMGNLLRDEQYSIPWSRRLKYLRYAMSIDREFAGIFATDLIRSLLRSLRLDGAARRLRGIVRRADPSAP